MKSPPILRAENFRITQGMMASTRKCGNNGSFRIPVPRAIGIKDQFLTVVVSDGLGWDHVSVSLPYRTPSWEEMCFIKDLFFHDGEVAIQYHPKKSQYVNHHRFCLHLFRPQSQEEINKHKAEWEELGETWFQCVPPGDIPMPPPILVGLIDVQPSA